mgnify:CR=1 FL=1
MDQRDINHNQLTINKLRKTLESQKNNLYLTMNKLYTDIDYSFLDKVTITELELFFANTNLTRE